MRLSELGEFGLIEKIRKATPKGRGVRLGIGDDAAWVEWKENSFLITSDLLVEGVHFDLKWTSFYGLGYKTLAVNLSDLAAMGGSPAYLVISLGIPVDFNTEYIEEFYRGITALASQSGVALVGGDTSASKHFFVSASLTGHAPYRPITRTGGKVGDDLYVTGTLGDSALGLKLLRRKGGRAKGQEFSYLVSRHQFPTARLQAGTLLAQVKLAKAMIDISDGLLQDLGHLCKASRIGAAVWEEALPLSRPYRFWAGRKGSHYAFTGGEDYELLFCLRRRDRTRLEKIKKRLGVPITRIGKCVPAREGIKVLSGEGNPFSIPIQGHDHFKKRL
ncbi:thiamine-phosphate kinase [candidate division TA06 bacterium]|nr:thiamine-phosphate kinase [candidate division TA06 bacterium]